MLFIRQANPTERQRLCINDHQDGTLASFVVEYEAKYPITHLPDSHYVEPICFQCAQDMLQQMYNAQKVTDETQA